MSEKGFHRWTTGISALDQSSLILRSEPEQPYLEDGVTWVVGSPTFRSCVGLADIQVTIEYTDGRKRYEDCIQKIFPLCRDISVGFCGSVQLGFRFIRDGQRYFGFPDVDREWSPYLAVHKWKRRLRWKYTNLPPQLKAPVEFLVLGVSPVNHPIPKTWGWTLKSPQFEPKRLPYGRVASIGSGNNLDSYMRIIRERNSESWDEYFNPNGLLAAEYAMTGGFGAAIGLEIAMEAMEQDAPGISKHFHICLVKRGEISILPNDHTTIPQDGPQIEIRMPPTVAGWSDFVKVMKSRGIDLSASTATA